MDFVCDRLGAEWTVAHQGRFDALASKPGKKDVAIRVVCRFPSPRMQAVELTAKGSTLKRDDRVVYPHSRKRRDHTDLQCFDQFWSPKLLNEDENRMIESSPRSKDIPHMHSIAVDFCGSIDSDLTELDFLLDSHALQYQHHKKRRRLDSTNTMVRTSYILHK